MKKFLALVLALTMVMAMAACGSKPAAPAAPAAPASSAAPAAPAAPAEKEPALDYPKGTVTWIAPVPAGAAVDLPTRALADMLDFGTVVVENIAGASQTLGTAEAAARPADGHTILTMANACGISQPILNPDLAYKLDDFRFLTMLHPGVAATICVKKGSDLNNIDKLLEYIKGGNNFIYALPNAGGYADIAAASALDQLGVTTGNKMVYDGTNGAIAAVLNGEALFSCTDSTDAVKHLDELEVVAIFDSNPCAILPGVPALGDYGVENLHVITGLKWVAVRKDTPAEIVDFLKEKIDAAVASDAYQQYLKTMGFLLEDGKFEPTTEAETTEIIESAGVVYKEVMEKTGMI